MELLLPEAYYGTLDGLGLIDQRFPLWWSLGFEGRRYVEPDDFFSGFQEIEGRPLKRGDDNKKIEFTILRKRLYGFDIPLFVTAKPLDEAHKSSFVDCFGATDSRALSYTAECDPHVRGICLGLDDEMLMWYPTRNGLSIDREFPVELAHEGLKLQDNSHFTKPPNFFGRIIRYHLGGLKRTYHNVNHKDPKSRPPAKLWKPFYNFDAVEDHMTILPVGGFCDVHLPLLVTGDRNTGPTVEGFTDSSDVYRIHKKAGAKIAGYVSQKFGLECKVG